MKHIPSLPSITILVLLFNSCNPSPNIVCNNCDEFVCRVNGNEFKPEGPWKSTTLSAITVNDTAISIGARNSNEFIGIGVKLNEPIKIGSYDLTTYPPGRGTYSNDKYTNIYYTNANSKGKFIVTKLEYGSRPVMEGIFYYEAQNMNDKSIARITDGSFKLFFARY
ncbi:hypothetical protein GCM10027578_04830 [Spirosoma luteolum]